MMLNVHWFCKVLVSFPDPTMCFGGEGGGGLVIFFFDTKCFIFFTMYLFT